MEKTREFVDSRLLKNNDTGMSRHELSQAMGVGMGNLVIGNFSNDRRLVLKQLTATHFQLNINIFAFSFFGAFSNFFFVFFCFFCSRLICAYTRTHREKYNIFTIEITADD